jgi:hypothetical protein
MAAMFGHARTRRYPDPVQFRAPSYAHAGVPAQEITTPETDSPAEAGLSGVVRS